VPRAALYPVAPMARWFVRMVVDGEHWREAWRHEVFVWGDCSLDAVGRARDEFYGAWATLADRERLPLRVVEVRQVSV